MGAEALYTSRAALYDAIYHFLDYKDMAARLHDILAAEGLADGATLLEAACGTGRYLEHLQAWYRVAGFDLHQPMLDVAAARVGQDVRLFQADMTALELDQPVDAIACLFSSIGYLTDDASLQKAAECFARALVPGGLLVIEPFISPAEFKQGQPTIQTYEDNDLKLCRAVVSDRNGDVGLFDFHWLVVPRGGPVEHFAERHELRLFDCDGFVALLQRAGLTARFSEGGVGGRGLVIARKCTP